MTGMSGERDWVAAGRLLAKVRKDAGLSQPALAKAIGKSDGLIGGMEAGTRGMTPETIEAVAEAIGLTREVTDELYRLNGRTRRSPLVANSLDDGELEALRVIAVTMTGAAQRLLQLVDRLGERRGEHL
jgi:transcriptional regulator with XRE-family HTH domain